MAVDFWFFLLGVLKPFTQDGFHGVETEVAEPMSPSRSRSGSFRLDALEKDHHALNLREGAERVICLEKGVDELTHLRSELSCSLFPAWFQPG